MKQLSTQLQNRQLRFDGAVVVSPEGLVDALLRGCSPSQIRMTEMGSDEEAFNLRADEGDELRLGGDPIKIDFSWILPAEYLALDVFARVAQAYEDRVNELYELYTPQQYDYALDRLTQELAEFEKRGMLPFLRTIIYILDELRRREVIWGVGRGSSCASYVLFILGLHSVDCILYDVPLDEFFHD